MKNTIKKSIFLMIIYLASSAVHASEKQDFHKEANIPSLTQMREIITKINVLDLKQHFEVDSEGNIVASTTNKCLRKEFKDVDLPNNPKIKLLLSLGNSGLNFMAKGSFNETHPIKLPMEMVGIFEDIYNNFSKFENFIDSNNKNSSLFRIRKELLKTLYSDQIEYLKKNQIVPQDDIFNFLSECIFKNVEPTDALKELLKIGFPEIEFLKINILKEYLLQKFGLKDVHLFKKLLPKEVITTEGFLKLEPHWVDPTLSDLANNLSNLKVTPIGTDSKTLRPYGYQYIFKKGDDRLGGTLEKIRLGTYSTNKYTNLQALHDIGSIEIHAYLPKSRKEKVIKKSKAQMSWFTSITNFLTGKDQNLINNNKEKEIDIYEELLKKENAPKEVVIDMTEETQSLLDEEDNIKVEIVNDILD